MRKLLRIAALLVAVIVAAPLVLTVVYAVLNPQSLPILRRQAEGRRVEQRWVPLGDIAPALVQSVIMSEDARFCLHWGVDLRQLRIVVQDALDGAAPRGASTITMQTVKNLFLWPQRSYARKTVEVPLAIWMDLILSKDRIVEIYLNIAQWGPDIYGIEAAAWHYFGKPAAALSADESLRLATTLPAPNARDPRRPGPRQQRAMAHVARELKRAPWVFGCLEPRLRP